MCPKIGANEFQVGIGSYRKTWQLISDDGNMLFKVIFIFCYRNGSLIAVVVLSFKSLKQLNEPDDKYAKVLENVLESIKNITDVIREKTTAGWQGK